MRYLLGFLTVFIFLTTAAQVTDHAPQLLKEPAGWEFERFALPPQFAPAIPYKGAEELRFAPGMFNKDSANYFTYVFVAQLDDVTAINRPAVSDYLLKYYKGLCTATAKDRKLTIDSTRITVTIENKKDEPAKGTIYNATIDLFGVFTDGAPVRLNVEVQVFVNTAMKKTYLFFIASPRQKKDPAWNELYAIRRKFHIPD